MAAVFLKSYKDAKVDFFLGFLFKGFLFKTQSFYTFYTLEFYSFFKRMIDTNLLIHHKNVFFIEHKSKRKCLKNKQ